jgi:hypothetical protein
VAMPWLAIGALQQPLQDRLASIRCMARGENNDLAPSWLMCMRKKNPNIVCGNGALGGQILLKSSMNKIDSINHRLTQKTAPFEQILYDLFLAVGKLRQLVSHNALGLCPFHV